MREKIRCGKSRSEKAALFATRQRQKGGRGGGQGARWGGQPRFVSAAVCA